MPAATVLIPTHDHAASLPTAIASVQEQTLQDFELLVVGDGVGEDTRQVMAEVARCDSRIAFLDFPKGPRKGEIHRHAALKNAGGRFVAYLGDDDLWMPIHLETMAAALQEADFAHSLHLGIDERGELFARPADLQNPAYRRRLLSELFNGFDLTFAGHTLAAYRRLPVGWRTTPPEFPWTDLYMWRQFLAEPWCRARSVMVPTAICTQTHLRPHLGNRDLAEELSRWRRKFAEPDFRESLWRKISTDLADEFVARETGDSTLSGVTAAASAFLQRRLPWKLKRRLRTWQSRARPPKA